MTASRKLSTARLASSIAVAALLALAPGSAQAGCTGCGFDVGIGIGGLALGALAAGSRSNERQYGYPTGPQGPRESYGRPPVVSYDPSDPAGPTGAGRGPARTEKRKAVAHKPAEAPVRKVATGSAIDQKAQTRTVAVAATGALEP